MKRKQEKSETKLSLTITLELCHRTMEKIICKPNVKAEENIHACIVAVKMRFVLIFRRVLDKASSFSKLSAQ